MDEVKATYKTSDEKIYHDPTITDRYGYTVAMYLS